jgi:hypothetical protein
MRIVAVTPMVKMTVDKSTLCLALCDSQYWKADIIYAYQDLFHHSIGVDNRIRFLSTDIGV